MLKKIYNCAQNAISRLWEDEVFVFAAQASFYIIIAAIPFLMLFMEILKFFIPVTQAEAVGFIRTFVPAGLLGFVEMIIGELFSKSTTVLSITGITALWSASRGMAAIERGVKKVYKTHKDRFFMVDIAFSLLYTFFFVAALVATLLLMVFGGTIFSFLKDHIAWIARFGVIAAELKNLMYFFIMFVFFTVMYKIFADDKSRIREHICGGLFATMGWLIFSVVFSIYVENFSNHSYIYGSLTMIVLMLLWLHSCMIILLLGAEINVWVRKKREEREM